MLSGPSNASFLETWMVKVMASSPSSMSSGDSRAARADRAVAAGFLPGFFHHGCALVPGFRPLMEST